MNKIYSDLDVLLGGMPHTINNIELIQENVKNLTSVISKGLSDASDPYILYGCYITVVGSGGVAPVLSISEGAIWNDGEIFIVDEVRTESLPAYTTEDDVLTTYEWDLNTVLSNPVLFADARSKYINERKTAIFTSTPATWSGVIYLKDLKEILKKESNLDITGYNYEDTGVGAGTRFTTLATGATGDYLNWVLKSYTLDDGQHIVRLITPSGENCTISQILPPSTVYDGYEITVEVKKHSSANRGLSLTYDTHITSVGTVTSNLGLQIKKVPFETISTGAVAGMRNVQGFDVTFLSTALGIYTDDVGTTTRYDMNLDPTNGIFRIILRWDTNTNKWNEVARTKYSS